LAKNRACANVPEVRKTILLFPDFQIEPRAIDVEALGSSGYDRFEREYGGQNTGKAFASTSWSKIRL